MDFVDQNEENQQHWYFLVQNEEMLMELLLDQNEEMMPKLKEFQWVSVDDRNEETLMELDEQNDLWENLQPIRMNHR